MIKIPKLWTILLFKPNAHKLAERNLKQQGFVTFLPLEKVTKYNKKGFISVKRPLFPGYMFVAFKGEYIQWNKINSTYGVSKVLTLNGKPCLIPKPFMINIISQCDQSGVLLPQKKFSKDDRVHIVSGPFNNFLATVESIDKSQRVWVLIDLMGQVTRASVKAEKLKYATI
ncbi:transcriptional activator RfaH [Amylibacter sp.]|nr:transcriptional activator RfaH [Amylibacter sp.]